MKFCQSEFWDANATWNATEHPDLTLCFEKSVLISIPCIYLWLLAPVHSVILWKAKDRHIPWSFFNVSKLIFSSLVILDLLYILFTEVHIGFNDDSSFAVDYYFTSLLSLTMLLQSVVIIYEKQRGIQSSWYMFLFWFLMVLCAAPQFRTNILDLRFNEDHIVTASFICYVILYPLILCLFFLNCFSDKRPQYLHLSRGERPCPQYGASFISRMTFSWLDGLIWRGYRQPIVQDELWDLHYSYSSKKVTKDWSRIEKRSLSQTDQVATYNKDGSYISVNKPTKRNISVLSILVKSFGPSFVFGSFTKLLHDIIIFIPPMLLSALISYSEDMDQPNWRGYIYALLLLAVTCLQSVLIGQYFLQMYLVGLKVRTAVIAAIYKKALLLSNSSRKEITIGEVVNLMSVDAQRFVEVVPYLNMLWSAPLQIFLSIYFLWNVLGPSVLAGLAVMVIIIPFQGFIATKQKVLQVNQMKYKDQRIKSMSEILNGVKVLKLYAWEQSFENQVLGIRDNEAKELLKAAYLNGGTSFFWNCTPYVVSLASFAVYSMISEVPLDSKTAFVSIALFELLRFPMNALPMMISHTIQVSVSLKRMNRFINSEELDPEAVIRKSSGVGHPILIKNGNFTWDNSEDKANTLTDLNLSVNKGALVAVVGSVGAGKSSLCSAILGEMNKISGSVETNGSIAYAPQQAWMQNTTLQENILFGKSCDDCFYNQVIEACALKPDLDILPAGDQTEIGEKGINLSGGQKQRINLARAVYNGASIILMDDPLSAVDSHVGKHIFENVIGPTGLLKNKTRILVTHSLTYLRKMDHIVVMTNGKISEQGTYDELLLNKGKFQEFLMLYLVEKEETDEQMEELEELKSDLGKCIGRKRMERQLSQMSQRRKRFDSECSTDDKKSTDGQSKGLRRLESVVENEKEKCTTNGSVKYKKDEKVGQNIIEKEKAETGRVSFGVYGYYIKAVGVIATAITFTFTFIGEGLSVSSGIWLAKWSADSDSLDDDKRNYYLGIYGLLRAAQSVCILVSALLLYWASLRAAVSLHKNLLSNLMRLPMNFFDINPVGRIINRFSKDVDTLDSILPFTVRFMITCLAQVISTFAIISYTTPLFIVVMIPLLIIYYFIQLIYVASSRQLRRIESISRSPIFSHFGETIQGASTIRAYNKDKDFILESQNKVDLNQISYYPSIIANRWLAIRLEFIGNILTFSAAIFVVMSRESTTAGEVGLSISYALSVTQTLNWLVRMTSDVETNIVAVERIKQYTETTQEAPRFIPEEKPPKEWPENGIVEFKNYSMRYREGLDLVVKGITCKFNKAEKIGIVGRTGAGKSSLTLSLFRIIEPAGGTIIIDNIDVSKIGLHELRGRLTIIPQDPVLFSGTLRMNLDPSNQYSDEQVWNALEHSHLKTFVSGFEGKLLFEVTEGGENLSVGQRQLVCLARALLRKSKVLVLDEATAAVDLGTDDLIQQTIRSEFVDSTIITIAHRLNTIMDSTRIVVMDKGKISEFDTPANLLSNEFSIFYGMAKDAGLI